MSRLGREEFAARVRGLIARLEAATGPDRALDRDILQAYVDREAGYRVEDLTARVPESPEYTLFVTEALTLFSQAFSKSPLCGEVVWIGSPGVSEHEAAKTVCIAALESWGAA